MRAIAPPAPRGSSEPSAIVPAAGPGGSWARGGRGRSGGFYDLSISDLKTSKSIPDQGTSHPFRTVESPPDPETELRSLGIPKDEDDRRSSFSPSQYPLLASRSPALLHDATSRCTADDRARAMKQSTLESCRKVVDCHGLREAGVPETLYLGNEECSRLRTRLADAEAAGDSCTLRSFRLALAESGSPAQMPLTRSCSCCGGSRPCPARSSCSRRAGSGSPSGS